MGKENPNGGGGGKEKVGFLIIQRKPFFSPFGYLRMREEGGGGVKKRIAIGIK